MLKSKLFLAVACLVALFFSCERILAGTIRHDRDDRLYTGMAANDMWHAVGIDENGSVPGNPQFICSATLIHPQWVIGAAHCIQSVQSQGPPRLFHRLIINGQQFDVGPADIFVHPDWILNGASIKNGFDIALFRLPRPVVGVRPLPLNASAREIGQVGFCVGYGTTGTGVTGNVVGTSDRRAGQNVIDADKAKLKLNPFDPNDNRTEVWGTPQTLVCDFDNPQRTASLLGSSAPLAAEYCIAPGDSGGPMLTFVGGRFTVVGICSGGTFRDRARWSYGTVTFHTRVSSFIPWINSVIAGNEPAYPAMVALLQNPTALATMQQAAAESRQYEAVLRANGWVIAPAKRQIVIEQPEIIGAAWLGRGRNESLADTAKTTLQRLAAETGEQWPTVTCPSCESNEGAAGEETSSGGAGHESLPSVLLK